MPAWRFPLLLAAAAAVGFGVWVLANRGDGSPGLRPPPTEGPSPLEVGLQEAADRLKRADGLAGHERRMEVDAASRRLADLEAMAPGDPRIPFWAGMAAVLGEDEAAARSAHARLRMRRGVTERDPALRFLGALIVLQFEPSKPDPAIRTLRALQAEAPGFMAEPVDRALYRALLQSAVVRTDAREAETVIRLVQEAVDRAKEDPLRSVEAHRMLAYAYSRAQRFVEAQEQWEWLVRRSEGQAADFVAGLASSFAVQNRWEEAVEQYTRAIALRDRGKVMRRDDPALDEVLLRRGNCYRVLGRTDLARADIEAHLATHPDDHRAMYWLGTIFLDPLDEPERAREHLEKARALAPWCDSYLRVLRQVYEIRLPDPAKAAALRREIEEGAEARRKERERLAKEHREGRFICE